MPTAPLADVLRRFVTDWNRVRPSTAGRFTGGAPEVSPLGAIHWLAAETAAIGQPVPVKTIQNVHGRRYANTELRVADPLVQALGRPDLFHDGTLTVIPNPSASRAARAACCGGMTMRF